MAHGSLPRAKSELLDLAAYSEDFQSRKALNRASDPVICNDHGIPNHLQGIGFTGALRNISCADAGRYRKEPDAGCEIGAAACGASCCASGESRGLCQAVEHW